jgi:hypothetical protein
VKQNLRVLNHLAVHGYITQVIASSYGIRRCASRISELKDHGWDIESNMKKDDAGVRYAYYNMKSRERKAVSRYLKSIT